MDSMVSKSHIEEKIRTLRKKIQEHDYYYHVLDAPVIPDSEYDKLYRELLNLEEAHPECVVSTSPTQRVAPRPVTAFLPHTHSQPMLSLNNAFSEDELAQFDKRIRQTLPYTGDLLYAC